MKTDPDFVTKFMEGIWNRLLVSSNNKVLIGKSGCFKVNPDALTISIGKKWYRCKKCGKITGNNVKNVCPVFHCDGELEQVDPQELFRGNHYYEMYQNLEIRPLRIVEHSAQLAKETAYEYEGLKEQWDELYQDAREYLIAVAYWPQKVKSFISDVIRNAERNRQEYRMENELQRREKHRRSDDWER